MVGRALFQSLMVGFPALILAGAEPGTLTAIFGLRNPAIVSMTVSFIVGIVVSLLSSEPSAEASFADQKLRTHLGIGAE